MNFDDYKIRCYSENDSEKIRQLANEAWQDNYDGYRKSLGDELFDVFFGEWEEQKHIELCRQMTDNGKFGRAHIIEDVNGTIIAMGSYRLKGQIGEICSNAVTPNAREKGFEKILYRRLLDAMKSEGIGFASVTVNHTSTHDSEIKAYEGLGFGTPLRHVRYYRKNRNFKLDIPSGVELRIPNECEYHSISELSVRAWEPMWAVLLKEQGDELFEVQGDRRTAKYKDTLSALKNQHKVALYEHGKLAGYATWFESGKKAVVGLNAVDRKFAGNGYGYLLQQYISNNMLEHGMQYSQVLTGGDDCYIPARRTYEKVGFEHSIPSVTYWVKL